MELRSLVDYVVEARLRNVKIPPEELGCVREVIAASSKMIGITTPMGFLLGLVEKNLTEKDLDNAAIPPVGTCDLDAYHASRSLLLNRNLHTTIDLAYWIDAACLALAASDYIKAADAMLVVEIKITLGGAISEIERQFVNQANSFLTAVAGSANDTSAFRNVEWIYLVKRRPSHLIDQLAGSKKI